MNRTVSGAAVGTLGSLAAAVLLTGLRGKIPNANVALVLVVFVLLGAAIGGRGAGVISALVAALSFNFFHTLPYNTLRITSADDVQTTVLLLVVGLIVGEITVRSQRIAVMRSDDWAQMRRLQRVAELASRGEEAEDLLLVVTAELMDMLDLEDCAFEWPPFASTLPRLQHGGSLTTTQFRHLEGGLELPRSGVELPVMGSGEILARFVLVPTPGVGISRERRLIAVALADQLGAALTHQAA